MIEKTWLQRVIMLCLFSPPILWLCSPVHNHKSDHFEDIYIFIYTYVYTHLCTYVQNNGFHSSTRHVRGSNEYLKTQSRKIFHRSSNCDAQTALGSALNQSQTLVSRKFNLSAILSCYKRKKWQFVQYCAFVLLIKLPKRESKRAPFVPRKWRPMAKTSEPESRHPERREESSL